MARTSKRYEIKKDVKNLNYYKCGIYTRLSHERTESYREKSSSIEMQIITCKEYALEKNIDILDVYTDYEYSGTNFERPEFIRMMNDIRNKRINCIIIRDLSRLGREHLEMGRLIDKVFPFLGVRFVSVNDNIDTINETDAKKSFEISVKNIINDMYAKDISVKVKSAKLNRAKNGYFIGSIPPFGYKINKTREGQILELDENTSPIVREIFDLTLLGKSLYEITKILNKKGYSTAMTYFRTGRIYRNENEPEWNKSTVSKLLKKPIYYGSLVQGTKTQNLAKGEKQRRTDKSEQIIIDNAVEPIITYEEYLKVLNEKKQRYNNSCFNKNMLPIERDPENRFLGKVINYYTRKPLYRSSRIYTYNGNKKIYYVFRTDDYNGMLHNNKSVSIIERKIDECLVKLINEFINKYSNKEILLNKVIKKYDSVLKVLDRNIDKNLYMISKKENELKKVYERYKETDITLDKYTFIREIILKQISNYKQNNIKLNDKKINLKMLQDKALEFIDTLYNGVNSKKLPKDLINILIDKIIVKDSNTFEIVFNFKIDEIAEIYYE